MNTNTDTSLAKIYNKLENFDNSNISKAPIYVDLNCFLKNIEVLKNRTDDLMIDLDLLITNIKSCSYVKKDTTSTAANKTSLEPSVVKLVNIPTNVVVSAPISQGSANVVDIIKEPFDNLSKKSIWGIKDLLVIIVICFIIYLLFSQKK
jgi:hypothetical protein